MQWNISYFFREFGDYLFKLTWYGVNPLARRKKQQGALFYLF